MMLFPNEFGIVGTINPQDGNNADPSTDEIDMSKFSEVAFVLMTGVVAASGTCDFKVRESQTAGGTYQDITGKAITQLVAADDNKQVVVVVQSQELSNGYRYIKGVMDNSAHSQLVAVVALGRANYQPATDHDLSSVAQVITA